MSQEHGSESMRLFIAVELPEQVRDELNRICEGIAKKKLFGGRCTGRENFHLTLKFLGEIFPDMVPKIDATLSTISASALDAHLGRLDVLPTREHIRILFVELLCPQLAPLAQQIEDKLADLFPRETRPFKSHVTVARVKTVGDKQALVRELDNILVPPLPWKIDSFVLKSSTLTKDGPIYQVVKRYGLY